jgi:hypothetical protein
VEDVILVVLNALDPQAVNVQNAKIRTSLSKGNASQVKAARMISENISISPMTNAKRNVVKD